MQDLPLALQIWDNAARTSLPPYLLVWLVFMVCTLVTSVFFVRRHEAARVLLVGVVLSHLGVVVIELGEIFVMRRGLVSLLHVVCWAPGWICVMREIGQTERTSPYGAWSRIVTGVIAIAFIFDLRDMLTYLYHVSTGHAVFA